jgi:dimethylhistidine N-methyltransferase
MQRSPAIERYTLIHSDSETDLVEFGAEVESGLTADRKTLPCRFFYDEPGSELFEEICDLPEYYVTRSERGILAARADEIAGHFQSPITLAELGSGSSSKTRLLIEALLRRHGGLRYVPVDISKTMLEASSVELVDRYEALEIRAIASEYEVGLRHLRRETDRPKLIAWLGSTIGNLSPDEAAAFLGRVRHAMSPHDRLLLGIDLRKDRVVLESAYDDSAGVTARFNLNLLERINRELSGEFCIDQFLHRAVWDERKGRVEMHLVSLSDQRVPIRDLGLNVEFASGETIHTESSYKYSLEEIDQLAANADLAIERRWLDDLQYFSLNLLAPRLAG